MYKTRPENKATPLHGDMFVSAAISHPALSYSVLAQVCCPGGEARESERRKASRLLRRKNTGEDLHEHVAFSNGNASTFETPQAYYCAGRTVRSPEFRAQHFTARVSNPRIMACTHLNMPLKAQSWNHFASGSILPD